MLRANVPATLIAAVMREFVDLSAEMSVKGLGTTGPFPFLRGGRQGGVETPQIFTMIVDYIMGPLTDEWDRKGYGFVVED
eukprot:11542727-Karenia_brevis.AAC.1